MKKSTLKSVAKFTATFLAGIQVGRLIQQEIIRSKFEDCIIQLATVKEEDNKKDS